MVKEIKKQVSINALNTKVWNCLTVPSLMSQWMADAEMKIQINTSWIVGTPIVVKGFHHVNFENRGTVLRFDPQTVIQYSHLSSISRLPDTQENYSIVTFQLNASEKETLLTIEVKNFPTESIYKHLDFYWRGTAIVLKNFIELQ